MSARPSPRFTVFTKPWPDYSVDELADLVLDLGFDGIELPVRERFQVPPDRAGAELPRVVEKLGRRGVFVGSVASAVNREMIAACGDAGVPLIRTMVRIDMEKGYRATEDEVRREWDALLPDLERFGVTIGLQNHCNEMIGSAIGIMHLIEDYDPRRVAAVLDTAHCGLDGEPDRMAIDIVWSHLALVNLKNGFWRRKTGPESVDVQWEVYWTSGPQGLTSWPTVADELTRRNYSGDVCLTAEYSNPAGQGDLTGDGAVRLIRDDLRFAKSLFGALT